MATSSDIRVTQEGRIRYRAVTEIELAEIIASRCYTVGPASEGKYFYPTSEQAHAFVARGWAVTITSADFTHEMLAEAEEYEAAGEGIFWYFPQSLFPHGPVTVEDTQ